jgi:polysaccharide biosynthesis transport protein
MLPLLLVSAVLSGAVAFVGASLQARVYEADATLMVGDTLSTSNTDYNDLLASQRLSKTYASLATTRPLLERVIAKLNLQTTPDELLKKVRAAAALDSTLLTVTAQDGDATRAAAIANAMAQELISSSPDVQGGAQQDFRESVQRELDGTQALVASTQTQVDQLAAKQNRTPEEDATLNDLQDRLATLRQTYASLLAFLTNSGSNVLSVIEPAVAPEIAVSPRPLFTLVLGVLIGLMIAVAVVFVVEYLDDTVKTADDVQDLVGLPTLGAIARIRRAGRDTLDRLIALHAPRSGAAEAYRTLGSNIDFAALDAPVRTLLVTSPGPREGKTFCAANLAIVLAQSGKNVLLVDADLRDPDLHHVFGVANSSGLTDLLRSSSAKTPDVIQPTDVDRLRLLTAGIPPAIPAELLGSQRMRAVLEKLQADADLVILDSPPLQAVADPAILSSLADATVLVVEAGRSRRATVRAAAESLARANARVLGVVLNRLAQKPASGYGPEFDDPRERPAAVGPAATEGGRTGALAPPR